MADEISISFDGVEVKTTPGKMVLEAAIDAGIYIPYLCYHPGMKPFAACRMCVVGVEGGRGYPAACALPVQDGMKIRNDAGDVQDLRRSVMDMLVAEHPNGCLTCHRVDICGPTNVCLRHVSVNDRCVTCPKNERCELKDTVRYLGVDLESPLEYKYRNIPLELGDPFYDRDYNLCIVCGRCVRACEELRGDDAIGFTQRSGIALVGTSFGSSLLESGCEFCGACIDVCPVGALVESDHKWEKAASAQRTVCPHCPVGCQLNLELNAAGQFIRSVPELNSPANRGQACYKGKFGLEFVNSRSRLKTPLVRRNGQLCEATWDEALELVANSLDEFKGNAFALLTSPNGTNEDHYLAQKFARAVMQSNNIDQTSNTQPELVLALERSLGYPAATNSIWDLEQSGCILVFNSNITEEQNVVGVPIKKASRKNADLVVIDPREVELTRYARLWLRPAPGTELMLLGGILRCLIDQGLEQSDWMDKNCESPATLHYVLHGLDLDEVSRVTGVSLEDMAEAARLYGEAGSSAIVYALDNIPDELQRDCVRSLVGLALVTGNVGKPGAGLYPMRRGANEQGAWDVGCLPDRLPGYALVSDDDARGRLEAAWGCTLPPGPGFGTAAALEAARDGSVKAMLIVGDSGNLENGKLGDGLAALDNLDFLVVLDTFLSPAAQRASVVLPRATFAEKEGTFTSLERRIQRLQRVLPVGGVERQSESWVFCQLARLMGAGGLGYAAPSEVMREIAQVAPIYGGVSYRVLDEPGRTLFRTTLESPQPTQVLYSGREHPGIQWPCDSENPAGTPTMYTDRFPSGTAEIESPQFRVVQPSSDPQYPYWYVPGRVLLQHDRPMEVVKGKRNSIVREVWLELNPQDAAAQDIREGDEVELEAAGLRMAGRARLLDSVPPGVIASTGLFGQLALDMAASEEMEPASRVPGLDVAPAKIAKLTAARP